MTEERTTLGTEDVARALALFRQAERDYNDAQAAVEAYDRETQDICRLPHGLRPRRSYGAALLRVLAPSRRWRGSLLAVSSLPVGPKGPPSELQLVDRLTALRRERRRAKDAVETLRYIDTWVYRHKTAVAMLEVTLGNMRNADEAHANRVYVRREGPNKGEFIRAEEG